jgi:hypothetical protein
MGAHRLSEPAPEGRPEAKASGRAAPHPAFGAEAALGSPVLQMHEAIAAEFRAQPEVRWPPIFGVAFVLGTAAVFWSAVSLIVQRLG